MAVDRHRTGVASRRPAEMTDVDPDADHEARKAHRNRRARSRALLLVLLGLAGLFYAIAVARFLEQRRSTPITLERNQ